MKILIQLSMLGLVVLLIFGCNPQTVQQTETFPEYEEVEMQPAPEQAASETVETTQPVGPVRPQRLATIYFDYDKFELSQEARTMLSLHAKKLEQFPDIKILIEGHCDERGTIEYNLALGDKRANMVKDYLVNYGIDPSRISTISYGKERPAVQGHSEAAWAQNRRAQFVITN